MVKIGKKAFTMVELLATITILGIVTVVAVVSVSRVMTNAKNEYYKGQEDNIILAAQSFVQNNTDRLPKSVGQTVKLPLSELVKNKYLKEAVKDYGKQDCDMEKSYVEITKVSQKEYAYNVFLECPNFKASTSTGGTSESEEEKQGIPSIDIKFDKNKNNEDEDNVVGIFIKGNKKLISYEYKVYSKGKDDTSYRLIKNSGSVEVKSKESIALQVSLMGYVPADIRVQVTATNSKGKTNKETATKSYIDNTGPKCIFSGNKFVKDDPSHFPWTNGNRTVTIGCIDTGSGCEKDIYTQTFKEDSDSGIITIKDRAGNTTNCKVQVYVDKTKPSCTSSGGVSKWSTKSITLLGTCKDNLSGCVNKPTNGKVSYEKGNVKYLIDTSMKASNVSPGTVYDAAGNSIQCPADQNVMVDVVKPKINSIQNPTNGNWSTKNFSVVINSSDDMSGLAYHQYRYKDVTKQDWKTYDNSGVSPFTTTPFSTNRTENAYFRVCDVAGNCSDEKPTMIKLDTKKPTCTSSGGSNSWQKDVTLVGKCSDENGCKDIKRTFSGTQNLSNQSPGTVYDTAGNSVACPSNQRVLQDKTAPTISLNDPYNGKWAGAAHSVSVTASDAHSGISYYQYRIGTGAWQTSYTSATSFSSPVISTNTTVEFKVCDKVGNCSGTVKSSVLIDNVKPTCRVSNDYGRITYDYDEEDAGAKVTLTCSDNSSVAKCGSTANSTTSTETVTLNKGSRYQTVTYTVTDGAGNSNTCRAEVQKEYYVSQCNRTYYDGYIPSECSYYFKRYYNNYSNYSTFCSSYNQTDGYNIFCSKNDAAYDRCGSGRYLCYDYDYYYASIPSYCRKYLPPFVSGDYCRSWGSYYYSSYCPSDTSSKWVRCQVRYYIYRY